MPQWTKQQLAAITTRGKNLLVSAAAGSGKTAVLVERVCHYLVNLRQDVERLLVVTFTEAAAAEMRQRIAAALREHLAISPDDSHLARQFALLEQAHISTIHSFCLWLLRRFFYRLDLDPAFRVLDEGEDRLFKLEVLERILEGRYENEGPGSAFYDLADRYSDRNGGMLRDLVLRLHDFSQSQVFPLVWLLRSVKAFELPVDAVLIDQPWYPVVREQACADVSTALTALQAALQLAERPNGPRHYGKSIKSDLVALQDLERVLHSGTWDEACHACAAAVQFAPARGRATNDVDQELLERVKLLRQEARKLVRNLASTVYTRPEEQMLEDLRSLSQPMGTLVELIEEFGQAYSQAKRARGVVNFSDLERLSLRLLLAEGSTPQELIPSETALELREHFTEVLCDEYQDINPVQDALLSLVAGDREEAGATTQTFMVGDIKQSIYRFRLAEPRIFLQRAERASRGLGCQRIDLSSNFRCRRTVVDGVNMLFRALMSKAVGDVEYDEASQLVYGAGYPRHEGADDRPIQVILLEGDPRLIEDARHRLQGEVPASGHPRPVSDSTGVEESMDDDSFGEGAADDLSDDVDLTSLEREAALIARTIRRLVKGDEGTTTPCLVWDKTERDYRPVRYRDVVVLLRATQVKASQFVDIFRQEGVPLYAETGSGYFGAPEVETMLAVLSVIDNPRQDIPLAGVLCSPLVGLESTELAEIRLARPQSAFYDAVQARAAQHDELGQKLQNFLRQLDEWRTRARRGPLAQLIWLIYRDSGYYDYSGGMPGGGQRQANLRALYDRARQFDQFARQGLVRFLQYIADLRAAGEDLGTAPALGENEDVVRLMSIHRSKGLEFPVVFVAGLGTKFNQRDLVGSLLYDRELGLGPQVVDPVRHTRSHTLASLGVRESIRRASLSEEMRILYVALTRARERLFLVATLSDLCTTVERWGQSAEAVRARGVLPGHLTTSAKRFIDWLGPVLSAQKGLFPVLSTAELGSEVCVGEVPGWRATLYPPGAVVREFSQGPCQRSEASATPLGEALSPEMLQQLSAQLSWTYPHAASGTVRAKTTVTELKRREAEARDPETPGAAPYWPRIFRRPAFFQAKRGLTVAEVGTATHLVMQHLPLQQSLTPDAVAACVADLVTRGVLTEKEGEAVDQRAIVRFAESPLGRRLQAVAAEGDSAVLRELPFTLAIPVAEAVGSFPTAGLQDVTDTRNPNTGEMSDTVILQGVIDCLFRTQGGWVLIDFKTDRLAVGPAAFEAEVRRRYEPQIRWYVRAVNRILHITVQEAYLYLLAHDLAVPVVGNTERIPSTQAFTSRPNCRIPGSFSVMSAVRV
jgi:ATP-dependent helicase/nuclease subunit A